MTGYFAIRLCITHGDPKYLQILLQVRYIYIYIHYLDNKDSKAHLDNNKKQQRFSSMMPAEKKEIQETLAVACLLIHLLSPSQATFYIIHHTLFSLYTSSAHHNQLFTSYTIHYSLCTPVQPSFL